MRRLSAFVLHAIAAGIMTWGWFSLLENSLAIRLMSQKGGHLLFLTNQGLFVTWTCMAISLFNDVFPSVAGVRHLKRTLLMVSLPLEFVITSIYWSLLLFFPHLIMTPIEITPGAGARPMGLPLSTDLAMHASPLLTLLIDFFAFEHKFSKTYVHKAAPSSVAVFTIWYASFAEYCATFNGSFPYPFLTYSPLPVRVLIYTATAGIALGCFRTLNALHA